MHQRILYAFFLLLTYAATGVAQSGWTKAKGAWYLQTEAGLFSSDQYYSTEGQLNNGNTFRSYALKTYGEYGLTDRFTAIVNWPILKLQNFEGTETVAGLGDLQLGFKYALAKKIPIAIGFAAEVPTDDGRLFAQAKELNELGIREQVNLPTSDGEWNFRTNLAVSQSFGQGHTYASLYGAINFRTKGFTNQWQAGAELGQFLFKRLWVIGKLNVQDRFTDSVNSSVSFLYGEGTTYTAYNVSLLYHLNDHWRITGGFQDYSDLLSSKRNIYDGKSFSLGVALEY